MTTNIINGIKIMHILCYIPLNLKIEILSSVPLLSKSDYTLYLATLHGPWKFKRFCTKNGLCTNLC